MFPTGHPREEGERVARGVVREVFTPDERFFLLARLGRRRPWVSSVPGARGMEWTY